MNSFCSFLQSSWLTPGLGWQKDRVQQCSTWTTFLSSAATIVQFQLSLLTSSETKRFDFDCWSEQYHVVTTPDNPPVLLPGFGWAAGLQREGGLWSLPWSLDRRHSQWPGLPLLQQLNNRQLGGSSQLVSTSRQRCFSSGDLVWVAAWLCQRWADLPPGERHHQPLVDWRHWFGERGKLVLDRQPCNSWGLCLVFESTDRWNQLQLFVVRWEPWFPWKWCSMCGWRIFHLSEKVKYICHFCVYMIYYLVFIMGLWRSNSSTFSDLSNLEQSCLYTFIIHFHFHSVFNIQKRTSQYFCMNYIDNACMYKFL